MGAKTLFIEPGSPWENGYIESFNGKLRDELLKGEIIDTVTEARVIPEQWSKTLQCSQAAQFTRIHPPAPEACAYALVANA